VAELQQHLALAARVCSSKASFQLLAVTEDSFAGSAAASPMLGPGAQSWKEGSSRCWVYSLPAQRDAVSAAEFLQLAVEDPPGARNIGRILDLVES